ncbi:hypothetical protein SANTM175S_00897 [Streptomyces antimycoticus]
MPTPAASARKAREKPDAASSTKSSSTVRSAGRSAFIAATAAPGRSPRTARAPCASAAFSPRPGESGRIRAPRADGSPGERVVGDDGHLSHPAARQRRAHRVLGERERERGPEAVTGGVGEPGLGP